MNIENGLPLSAAKTEQLVDELLRRDMAGLVLYQDDQDCDCNEISYLARHSFKDLDSLRGLLGSVADNLITKPNRSFQKQRAEFRVLGRRDGERIAEAYKGPPRILTGLKNGHSVDSVDNMRTR